MKDFILKHFKILNKVFGRYRFFQVILRYYQRQKDLKDATKIAQLITGLEDLRVTNIAVLGRYVPIEEEKG